MGAMALMHPFHVTGNIKVSVTVTEKCPSLYDTGSVVYMFQSAAHRDKSRGWNVSKQKWNLC